MSKLKEYFKITYHIEISDLIDDVGTNLDGSNSNQVIFYRLKNGGDKALKNRLENSRPGLLILSRKPTFKLNINHLVICDERFESTQTEVCEILYPIEKYPKIIGVTGTNGKTSVCYFGMQVGNSLGFNCLSVGTIGVYGKNGKLETEHRTTTPSKVEFYKIIYKNKPQVVFIELSSHAIEQERLGNILLDSAAWTNFSQDHLDYHHSMESYFNSKLGIIKYLKNGKKLKIPKTESDLAQKLMAINVEFELVDLVTNSSNNMVFDLEYNLKNISLAIFLIRDALEIDKIDSNILKNITSPPGRFDVIPVASKSHVVVDYAHTPDAVEQILKSIKSSYPDHKVYTIVGCGGNRDKAKRPLMARAACENSDLAIFTSDNPRDEEPISIIKDMISDIEYTNYKIEVNRREAINIGVQLMNDSTILLVLGKGHEAYQEVGGRKLPFDDKLEAEKIIKALK